MDRLCSSLRCLRPVTCSALCLPVLRHRQAVADVAAERAPGGLGVMLDDIVAGVFAAILIAAIHATGVI